MTNGEVMISTIESVMGVEFDKSFGWKELDHDVVIAFDGSWWREDKYADGERKEPLPQYEEWQDKFNKMCESAKPTTFVADEWYRDTFKGGEE